MLAAQSFGSPGASALLLVAGSGACMMSWEDEFCQGLAAGRHVVRFDQRGTGQSTMDFGPVGPDELAGDAIGLLDRLGIARAHLVGASAGGAVAQLMALGHGDRVASLTLLAASPEAPGGTALGLPGPSLRMRIALDDVEPPDWRDPESVAAHLVELARLRAGRERPFDSAAARALARRIVAHAADPRAGLSRPAAAGRPWHHRLPTLTVPTLVVHGTADPVVPFAHGEELAARIPGARLLPLPGAGHDLDRADWPVVIEAIRRHTGPP